MKRESLIMITFIALAAMACSLFAPVPAEQPQPGVATIVAATLQSMPTNPLPSAEPPTRIPPTAPAGTPLTYQNVSFVIPAGLASGADGEVVPEATEANSDPWSVGPAYIRFTLKGYSISINDSLKPEVRIYPAQELAAANSWADGSLKRLQAVLASPAAALSNDNLPTVPYLGAAAQQYAAQAKLVPFKNGNGVRMLSQYAQFPGPIIKNNSFYHYEGLTQDGKYFVSVLLPVVLPLKSSADNTSADGVPYPSDLSNTVALDAYFKGMTSLLDSANPDTFQPVIPLMDALVQSINVTAK